jgi:hypothetical protein
MKAVIVAYSAEIDHPVGATEPFRDRRDGANRWSVDFYQKLQQLMENFLSIKSDSFPNLSWVRSCESPVFWRDAGQPAFGSLRCNCVIDESQKVLPCG